MATSVLQPRTYAEQYRMMLEHGLPLPAPELLPNRLQWSEFIPTKPTPLQRAFLEMDDVREVFYGGAAGGGKSEALLMGAAQYVHVPNYAALILRRSFSDLALPGALMDRGFDWFADRPGVRWRYPTWTFPSGATITFGYLKFKGDKYRYQSSEFQYIGFDELTHFPVEDYRYLFSRLRRLKNANVPIRMRSASNPGGVGHTWVKDRFIDPPYRYNEEGRLIRLFVPAKLGDNPHLDREEYTASLMNLDPFTRQQLLEGDWTARLMGGLFQREWFDHQIIEPEDVPPLKRKVRYWDLAATADEPGGDADFTAGCLIGISEHGQYYVLDMRHARLSPARVEALVARQAKIDGQATQIKLEQEPGSSGKALVSYYHRKVVPGYSFAGDPVTGDKESRARAASSMAEAKNVFLVRGSWDINGFLDELEGFPYIGHDDRVDAFSGAFNNVIQPEVAFEVIGEDEDWAF